MNGLGCPHISRSQSNSLTYCLRFHPMFSILSSEGRLSPCTVALVGFLFRARCRNWCFDVAPSVMLDCICITSHRQAYTHIGHHRPLCFFNQLPLHKRRVYCSSKCCIFLSSRIVDNDSRETYSRLGPIGPQRQMTSRRRLEKDGGWNTISLGRYFHTTGTVPGKRFLSQMSTT